MILFQNNYSRFLGFTVLSTPLLQQQKIVQLFFVSLHAESSALISSISVAVVRQHPPIQLAPLSSHRATRGAILGQPSLPLNLLKVFVTEVHAMCTFLVFSKAHHQLGVKMVQPCSAYTDTTDGENMNTGVSVVHGLTCTQVTTLTLLCRPSPPHCLDRRPVSCSIAPLLECSEAVTRCGGDMCSWFLWLQSADLGMVSIRTSASLSPCAVCWPSWKSPPQP